MAFQLVCDYCKQAKKLVTITQIKDIKEKWICPECLKTQEQTIKYIETIGMKFKQQVDGMMRKYQAECAEAISKEAEKRFGNGVNDR